MNSKHFSVRNTEPVSLDKVPILTPEDFNSEVKKLLSLGYAISAYFADENEEILYAVCTTQESGLIKILRGKITDKEFSSIATEYEKVQLFEREIYESTKLTPKNHPWLKPVRFPQDGDFTIGKMDFFKMNGDEIHEVAVGPVHAGVIEPGHFRFQCHGETVYNLEISLGYQHRGIENKIAKTPDLKTLMLMETLCGDSTIAHATAYSQAIESLSNVKVSPYDNIIRAIALELERCANHIGDIGALAGDAGYLPTQSYCGRIRGDFLNMTALICGNRFGRGLVVPGGVGYAITTDTIDELERRIKTGLPEFLDAAKLLFENPSILSRFEDIGNVSYDDALKIGLVGPASRACGIRSDIRQDYPYGQYCFSNIPVATYDSGTVLGRAYIRWIEVQNSVAFIVDQLAHLKKSNRRNMSSKKESANFTLMPNSLVVSLTEGWRGEVCHVVKTDSDGNLIKYKIYDPSFHNWQGLSHSLKNQQISDFPLCNKSFNLSYCGHDL